MIRILVALIALLWCASAHAQGYMIVTSCGSVPSTTPGAGHVFTGFMDTNGNICTNSAGGGSSTVTALPSTGTGAYSSGTVGTSSAASGIATPTKFLDINNDSATATIAICFGSCTAVVNGAGSITITPGWHRSWEGSFVPTDAINWIASAASTPVTVGVK